MSNTRGRCRRCGCTPRRACRLPSQGPPLDLDLFSEPLPGCFWVGNRLTLCSVCWERPWRRRYRRPRLGHTKAQAIRRWYAERLAREADLVQAYERAYAADHGTHRHFEIDVDGKPMRILGDPEMDPETCNALVELGRAIDRQFKRGPSDGTA